MTFLDHNNHPVQPLRYTGFSVLGGHPVAAVHEDTIEQPSFKRRRVEFECWHHSRLRKNRLRYGGWRSESEVTGGLSIGLHDRASYRLNRNTQKCLFLRLFRSSSPRADASSRRRHSSLEESHEEQATGGRELFSLWSTSHRHG